MPTVAEQLRRAREAQSLDIYQVAEITKIKTDHIRALEAGEYETFSAPVYIRGFVRTYGRVLKLDVARLGEELDQELSQTEKFREPPPLVSKPHGALDFFILQLSKLNWRIVLAALIIAVIIVTALSLFQGWRNEPDEDPLRHLGPGLYEPKQPSPGELLPLPPNGAGR